MILEITTPQNQTQNQSKSKSKSKYKENVGATLYKPKKTHYKNYSNPNIIPKTFDLQPRRKEKNTSFHSKNEVSKHDISTNLGQNAYLPHVKAKQTILEYELFKKQKKSKLLI